MFNRSFYDDMAYEHGMAVPEKPLSKPIPNLLEIVNQPAVRSALAFGIIVASDLQTSPPSQALRSIGPWRREKHPHNPSPSCALRSSSQMYKYRSSPNIHLLPEHKIPAITSTHSAPRLPRRPVLRPQRNVIDRPDLRRPRRTIPCPADLIQPAVSSLALASIHADEGIRPEYEHLRR